MKIRNTFLLQDIKISIFEVSGKWILQHEQGPFLVTYKYSHFDFDFDEICALINDENHLTQMQIILDQMNLYRFKA